MNLSMNEVQSDALAKYNIHDYLDDEKSATSWNVEKGSAVLHQLMKEQDKFTFCLHFAVVYDLLAICCGLPSM